MRNNSPCEAENILKARNITYSDFLLDLDNLHDRVKSWRFVGEVLGVSGAYARLITQGHRVASQSAILRWIEYRSVNKPPSPKRPPRRFYRPCLSVELGQAIKDMDLDPEIELWRAVNARIVP